MAKRLLTDDFIDEAQVRFARATTKELARYIEDACAKQVAELERERDEWRRHFNAASDAARNSEAAALAAESREKQARVVGAREALSRCYIEFWRKEMTLEAILDFRDREYPATGEEPTRGADVVGCDGKCCVRPAPPAEGEPKCVLTHGCRKIPSCERVCWLADPTPQAVTEPPKCVWCGDGNGGGEYGLCAECRAIIRDCVRDALASRPAASGEG